MYESGKARQCHLSRYQANNFIIMEPQFYDLMLYVHLLHTSLVMLLHTNNYCCIYKRMLNTLVGCLHVNWNQKKHPRAFLRKIFKFVIIHLHSPYIPTRGERSKSAVISLCVRQLVVYCHGNANCFMCRSRNFARKVADGVATHSKTTGVTGVAG